MKRPYPTPYAAQIKLGLIAIAVAAILGLMSLLLGCGQSYTPAHEVVQNERYDAPAKSQITIRIVLKDSINKENVRRLLEKHFQWSVKASNPPSHIFIYVYAPGADWKLKDSGNWLGMVSRIANEDKGMEFAEIL